MPELVPKRIVIYTKDVINITGKKDRAARKLLRAIRTSLNKSTKDYVTVDEFSKYTGIKEELIFRFLN